VITDDKFNYRSTAEFIAKKTKSLRVVRFFPNSDLRCAHDGLRKVALENEIDPWKLDPGEFLVFANSRQNMLKIFAPGNLIVHVKSPDERRIDLDIIRLIPRFFNGTEFNYQGAVKEMIQKKIQKAA
jgi:hypothetical protein